MIKPPAKHVRFLKIGQVALVLGLSRDTVKGLVQGGTFEAKPLPGSVRRDRYIPRDEVERYRELMEEGITGGESTGRRRK